MTADLLPRLKVLALVHIPLDPEYPNGFSNRLHGFFRALAEEVDLHLLLIRGIWDDGVPEELMRATDIRYQSLTTVMAEKPAPPVVATQSQNPVARLGALLTHLTATNPIPSAFRIPAAFDEAIQQLKPQLVIGFHHLLAHFVLQTPQPISCLFILEEGEERQLLTGAYNVEDVFAPLYKRLWRKVYWFPYLRRYAALYRQCGERGHILAISEAEKKWFKRTVPASKISVIPLGMDCEHYQSQPVVDSYDIGIFGVFSQKRNYEPIFLLYQALTKISQKPLRWLLVGQSPHAVIKVLAEQPNVTLAENVPDTRPYYRQVRLVIAPAMTGAGSKSTVLKAWAMGRPVLTTPHGIKGLPAQPGINIAVADGIAGLARLALQILHEPERLDHMGARGRQSVVAERNANTLAQQFTELCVRLAKSEDPP